MKHGGFFKKNKNQEDNQLTTLEQIRKAYEDLSDDDKKSFHQSIADRVHESIAAQERADGNKDSQSAEAREHEALGAEHAGGKGDVSELHEKDDTPEERHEDRQDKAHAESEEWRKSAEERFAKIEAALEKLSGGDKLQAAREKYGLSATSSSGEGKKEFTEDDVKKLLA